MITITVEEPVPKKRSVRVALSRSFDDKEYYSAKFDLANHTIKELLVEVGREIRKRKSKAGRKGRKNDG